MTNLFMYSTLMLVSKFFFHFDKNLIIFHRNVLTVYSLYIYKIVLVDEKNANFDIFIAIDSC